MTTWTTEINDSVKKHLS